MKGKLSYLDTGGPQMPFEPLNEAHAIEKISTVFRLQNPIPTGSWPDVIHAATETAREAEFPQYIEAAQVQLLVAPVLDEPGTVEARLISRHGGIGFRQGEPPPAPMQREFVVSRNELRIDSYVYVRWSGYRAVVEEILRGLAPTVFLSSSTAATQLEYTDVFVHPGPMEEIRWSEVLQPSVAATAEQLGRRDLWHSHVGWFELDQLGRQVLVRTEIDAIPREPGLVSLRIKNLLELRSPIGQPGSVDVDLLLVEIDRLHERSKQVVGNLLSEQIVQRISLFSPEED